MTVRVAINGFGRMGRLALRVGWERDGIEFVAVNEPEGGIAAAAHLLKYDSIHGKWPHEVTTTNDEIVIDGRPLRFSSHAHPSKLTLDDVDVVLECSGKFKSTQLLRDAYIARGVRKVIVSAPVKDGALNLVAGINDHLYDPDVHDVITAASCTTNCLAPVVKVIHENLRIRHGVITTIHDMTNTQNVVDAPHDDLRRARAASLSLIPTTTGSATAIALIYPELKGRLNGLAVRVPLLNASITDAVFEVEQPTSVDEVNALFRDAAAGPLGRILGYEELPLVSVDYRGETRSAVLDAGSTMVVDGTQVKVLAWYDNETGYVHRMLDLLETVAHSLAPGEQAVAAQS
ncbi:MAG TPA: ArsJ-associated glyceraldehyde-3-phosphate dehydrogenase [Thermoanaerobaculia bacterium]